MPHTKKTRVLHRGEHLDEADLARAPHVHAAACATVASGHVHDAHVALEGLLASVDELLERLRIGKGHVDGNVRYDGIVCDALDFGHLLFGHHAAEVAGNNIVVHVKAHVVKAELRVDDAREDVLARVILHVVEAPLPVEDALHFGADFKRLVAVVHDAFGRAARVEHGDAPERSVVGGLTAALGIEGRVLEHDLEALFAFHARGHLRGEFADIGVTIEKFGHGGHGRLLEKT